MNAGKNLRIHSIRPDYSVTGLFVENFAKFNSSAHDCLLDADWSERQMYIDAEWSERQMYIDAECSERRMYINAE